MDPSSSAPDFTSLYLQELGALLFAAVFLFLYRQSQVVYFGWWAVAWLLRCLAAVFGFELLRSGHAGWLAPYAGFEFGFVMALISAARAGFASGDSGRRAAVRLLAVLPVYVAAVYALWRFLGLQAYHVSHAIVLAFVYSYNYVALGRRSGGGNRLFRFSLLMLAAVFIEHALFFVYLYHAGAAPAWALRLHTESYHDFALHCVLVFAAMAMWSESQIDRLRSLGDELDFVRRESSRGIDLDRLTGLFNQAALSRRIEAPGSYEGVVAVCDMDNFKHINDRYGHLVGDEILRNIGNLLQSSIRHEDEAFRWGGDEFVILFRGQYNDLARNRMGEIEARLRDFRVRGHGVLPIAFSWGTAEGYGRPLRDAIDEADRNMYTLKRSRAGSTRARPPAV